MKRKTRILLYSLGGLGFAAVAIVAAITAMVAKGLSGSWPWELRTPVEYRIPDGYIGSVELRWGVPGTPQLTKPGKYLVVNFDANGRAVTSSPQKTGWAHDRYYYVSSNRSYELRNTGWCHGGMIWQQQSQFSYAEKGVNGRQVFAPNLRDPVETFFVGPEELYRKTTDPQGKIYHPCR